VHYAFCRCGIENKNPLFFSYSRVWENAMNLCGEACYSIFGLDPASVL
jgi:hypothetical protein